jgi:hypothetical protein
MSIFAKIFGNVPATPAAAPVQMQQMQQQLPTPGNIPNNTVQPTATNPTVPADGSGQTQNTPQGLDKFTDVWNIKPEDLPKPPESPFAGVTPEAVQQIAGKTDFSKVITEDMMAKISAGGQEGVAATITALNAVAQQTYAQSATASMKLIETALEKQRVQFESQLPNIIKQQNVTNSLRNQNPIFSHPAAAPMLDMFAKQLQLKNPTADEATIKAQAQEFLLSFADAANPQKANTQTGVDPKTGNKTDWSDFFGDS